MDAWLSRFQRGSFRGVEFFTESHEFSGGRRRVNHEFPQRNENTSEDLGLKTRTFSIEMYVLSDDYFPQRDALLRALEVEGPGELIHPYLGRKIVQTGGFSLRETKSESRIARFSVDFTEQGEQKFPTSEEDDIERTLGNAQVVQDNSKNLFDTIFSVANQPAYVVQSAADGIQNISNFMQKSVAKVTEPVSNLAFAISDLRANAESLAKKPEQLSQQIKDTFDLLFSEFEGAERDGQKIAANFKDFDSEFDTITGTTNSRLKQKQNQDAIINIAKQQAFANEAKNLTQIEYNSVDEAVTLRDNLIENLNLEIDSLDDDNLFQSIQDLKSSLVGAIPPVNTSELTTFKPADSIPALVIAYELYEDLDREEEIINQNKIVHPGFVPGGEELEVVNA